MAEVRFQPLSAAAGAALHRISVHPARGRPLKAIFLTGMMGSGKTTVGRVLAKKLGWRFIDTDRLIRAKAGMSIPALFQSQGEARFRRLESGVLRGLDLKRPAVVATGGGIVLSAANRAWMRRKGLVIHLKVGTATLARRLKKGASRSARPLLSGGLKALETLARSRAGLYAQADLVVGAAKAAETVACAVMRACLDKRLVLN